MNILLYAKTYYQVIVCLHLRKTLYIKDNVSLIVSDVSVGVDALCERLVKEGCFESVKIAHNYKKTTNLKDIIFSKRYILKCINNYERMDFDSFGFCNYDLLSYSIINELVKNDNSYIFRFEEGYSNYVLGAETFSRLSKLFNFKMFFKGEKIDSIVRDMYYFWPELVCYEERPWNIKKLPIIDDSWGELYNNIFLEGLKKEEFNFKYIFFEESYFEDGIDVGDLEIVRKIADVVGKKNILVKLHPRTHIDRFEEYGICTLKTVGVPWEAIQYCNKMENIVFITISSGSVLYPGAIFGEFNKTYMLFDCLPEKTRNRVNNYRKYLEKYLLFFNENRISVPMTMDDFFSELIINETN